MNCETGKRRQLLINVSPAEAFLNPPFERIWTRTSHVTFCPKFRRDHFVRSFCDGVFQSSGKIMKPEISFWYSVLNLLAREKFSTQVLITDFNLGKITKKIGGVTNFWGLLNKTGARALFFTIWSFFVKTQLNATLNGFMVSGIQDFSKKKLFSQIDH